MHGYKEMTAELITRDKIIEVVSHLSQHSLQEIKHFNITLKNVIDIMESTITNKYSCAFVSDNRETVALLGVNYIDNHSTICRFIFTEKARQYWVFITKKLKQIADRGIADKLNILFIAYFSDNSEIHRWYSILGFRLKENNNNERTYIREVI